MWICAASLLHKAEDILQVLNLQFCSVTELSAVVMPWIGCWLGGRGAVPPDTPFGVDSACGFLHTFVLVTYCWWVNSTTGMADACLPCVLHFVACLHVASRLLLCQLCNRDGRCFMYVQQVCNLFALTVRSSACMAKVSVPRGY